MFMYRCSDGSSRLDDSKRSVTMAQTERLVWASKGDG